MVLASFISANYTLYMYFLLFKYKTTSSTFQITIAFFILITYSNNYISNMTENSNILDRQMNRRSFLNGMKKTAKRVAATYLVNSIIGGSQKELPPFLPEVYKHTINGVDLYFSQLPNKATKPFITPEGQVIDLATRKTVAYQATAPDALLVGNKPPIFEGRDISITPEFIQASVMEEIIDKGNKNVDYWIKRMTESKSKKNASNTNFDEMNPEIAISTESDIDFTPNQLLKLTQFTNAISDVLNYDRFTPGIFKDMTLAERLVSGFTNCQEFAATTAVILAGEPLKMPSDIIRFDYKIPEKIEYDEVIQEQQTLGHICNVINFNNTPVVIDTTIFGGGMMTLSDYLSRYSRNGINITSRIEYSSFLSPDSYEAFPWHDSEWINAETALGLNAAAKSAT